METHPPTYLEAINNSKSSNNYHSLAEMGSINSSLHPHPTLPQASPTSNQAPSNPNQAPSNPNQAPLILNPLLQASNQASSISNPPPQASNQPPPASLHPLDYAKDMFESEVFLYFCTVAYPICYALATVLWKVLGKEVNICEGVVDSLIAAIPFASRAAANRLHIGYIWIGLVVITGCLPLTSFIPWPQTCIGTHSSSSLYWSS